MTYMGWYAIKRNQTKPKQNKQINLAWAKIENVINLFYHKQIHSYNK